MRLIDADRLLKVLSKYEDDSGNFKSEYEYGLMQMLETIGYEVDDAPTVEAMPIVHGKWIDWEELEPGGIHRYYCSVCGCDDEHAPGAPVNYCWKCGARMERDDG